MFALGKFFRLAVSFCRSPRYREENAGLWRRSTLAAPASWSVLALGLGLGLGLGLAGCGYTGGVDNPLTRHFSWFNFLNGDDIRRSCGPTQADHYRLVYNGRYHEQVRLYEAIATPAGDGGRLGTMVIESQALLGAQFRLPTALSGPGADVNWGQDHQWTELDSEAWQDFLTALERSQVGSNVPTGENLASYEVYWTVVGCVGGEILFDVFRYPSARFEALTFDDWVFAQDPTGIPVNPPQLPPPGARFWGKGGTEATEDHPIHFNLRVGQNGFSLWD